MIAVNARPSLFDDVQRAKIEMRLNTIEEKLNLHESKIGQIESQLVKLQRVRADLEVEFRNELSNALHSVSELSSKVTALNEAEVDAAAKMAAELTKREVGINVISSSIADAKRELAVSRFSAKAKAGKVFYHSGDLGDIIYALPTLAFLGGGTLVLGPNLGVQTTMVTREAMSPKRMAVIAPLLEAQPYIRDVFFSDQAPLGAINLNTFRQLIQRYERAARLRGSSISLYRYHMRALGVINDDETVPWLRVTPKRESGRTIAVARSARYHRQDFPWKALVTHHERSMFFLGSTEEWQAMREETGVALPHVKTPNLLAAAEWISGAKVFIGNQSCPNAIAEGLKVPIVQETCPFASNCLFARQDLLAWSIDPTAINIFLERYT